jgi:hypothetical protein
MKAAVQRLCRRFPSLEPEDAAQYLAEARATLGEQATEAELLTWAIERAKADGYDDPIVIAQDQEDEDGTSMAWETTLSDEGAGAQAMMALVGLWDAQIRKGLRVSKRRLKSATQRILAKGPLGVQTVAWGRFGRLLYGLPQETFRRLAQDAGVALGSAWNLEQRIRHAILAELKRPVTKPEQLSWLPAPPVDPPTPAPPEAAAPTEDPRRPS